MCVCVRVHTCVTHTCRSLKVRKEHWISWNWSYRQLGAALKVLGTEPRYSARMVSALNH